MDFLVRRGKSADIESMTDLPLEKEAEVFRDRWGIPHVFAGTEKDLCVLQGFLHAADRLWQMETIRRLADGTLAEITGESMIDTDHFSRLAGFKGMRTAMLAALNEEESALCEAYAAGVNGYLAFAGKNLPLEFRFLKTAPAPWSKEDVASFIPLNAWFLETNYLEEILAVLVRRTMTGEVWNELYAVNPGASPHKEDFFERFGGAAIGPFLPAVYSFYASLSGLRKGAVPGASGKGSRVFESVDGVTGGSNNWAVSKGPNGKPLVANDPHLENTVPQIWYFCHLSCPTVNVCGASLPGVPGIIIGRNEGVAWGLTNVMTDCCDLFILKVKPDNPASYLFGGEYRDMEKERIRIAAAGGKTRELDIYRTVYGPVITELRSGIDAAVSLCWYGTYRGEPGVGRDGKDTTLKALFAMNKARNVHELISAAKHIKTICQNIVSGDSEGNIAWYASGGIPIRRGYSGRLPADGCSGACGWTGFIDPELNPSALNPPEGFIATANNRTIGGGYPYTVTNSWAAPYRHRRITELIQAGKGKSLEDFEAMQMDVYSKRAEAYLPVLLGFTYTNPKVVEAADMLAAWDRFMTADSKAGLVFEVFLKKFADILLADILGDYMPVYTMYNHLHYTVTDVLFARESGLDAHGRRAREQEGAGNADSSGSQVLMGKDLGALCEEALAESMAFIEKTLGTKRESWSWGRVHRYLYTHPGARKGPAAALLGRGPYPAPGSTGTVNLAFHNLARCGGLEKTFKVTAVPSLRFLTDLSSIDSSRIMGPLGQSGRPGTRHYADLIGKWIKGESVSLPLSRAKSEEISVSRTVFHSRNAKS